MHYAHIRNSAKQIMLCVVRDKDGTRSYHEIHRGVHGPAHPLNAETWPTFESRVREIGYHEPGLSADEVDEWLEVFRNEITAPKLSSAPAAAGFDIH